LSSLIGFERQWRNRLGLRTNTLVALGAASFVIYAALLPNEDSPTRVAAQVVSGIGFLGAGLIFREGLSVRGLNTAARSGAPPPWVSWREPAFWPMPPLPPFLFWS
jgi:putative Mg2+ transporter-C (MgtC) family protein